MKNRIILIGFPKCGKTTVGKELAKTYRLSFVDTDEEIMSQSAFPTIRVAYLSMGAEQFRKTEEAMIEDLQSFEGVISTGGGVPLREKNRTLLKKMGTVVYLEEHREILFQRMVQSSVPAYLDPLNLSESFEKLIKERQPIYESFAHCKVFSRAGIEKIWEVIHLEGSSK